MEFINERYRLIKKLKYNPMYTSYVAEDMRTERICKLNIFLGNDISLHLIKDMEKEFLGLLHLSSYYMEEAYSFMPLNYIDGKKVEKGNYIFVFQRINEDTDILEYRDNIDFYISLCEAVYYLHLNGLCYGYIDEENIFVKDGHAVLRNVAHCWLLEDNLISYSEDEVKNDIAALASMISDLLPKETAKLQSVIENAEEGCYDNINEMVDNISEILGKKYNIVDCEKLEELNFNVPFVGRTEELKKVLQSVDRLVEQSPDKRVISVEGRIGIGKTRFLKELFFRIYEKDVLVYKAALAGTEGINNLNLWKTLLKQVLPDAGQDVIDKYSGELGRYFPETFGIANRTGSGKVNEVRMVNRIVNFIKEALGNRPAVFLIDNFHNASNMSLEIGKHFLYELMEKSNVIFIFSYNDFGTDNKKFIEFINLAKAGTDVEEISLKPLDSRQTIEYIGKMLSVPYPPKDFGSSIYEKVKGDPLFTRELLKALLSNNKLIRSPETGEWDFDALSEKKLEDRMDIGRFLKFPDKLSGVMNKHLLKADEKDKEILEYFAFFRIPLKMELFKYFIDEDDTEERIKRLEHRNFLSTDGTGNTAFYIDNNILKSALYNSISDDKKRKVHREIVEFMQKEKTYKSAFSEYLYHLDGAGMVEEAIMFCFKTAKEMHEVKNIAQELELYEYIIEKIPEKEGIAYYRHLIRTGKLYAECGSDEEAIKVFNRAYKCAEDEGNDRLKAQAAVCSAGQLYEMNEFEKTENQLAIAEKSLDKSNFSETEVEILRLRAGIEVNRGNLDAAKEECRLIIRRYKELPETAELMVIMGSVYIMYGYVLLYKDGSSDAVNAFYKALNFFGKGELTSRALVALINLGCLHRNNGGKNAIDEKCFLGAINKAEKYGIETDYVALAWLNLGISKTEKCQYVEAEKCYRAGLDIAERKNYIIYRFLCYCHIAKLSIDTYRYADAEMYIAKAQKLLKEKDMGIFMEEYYYVCADWYTVIGSLEEAKKALLKYKECIDGTGHRNVEPNNIEIIRNRILTSDITNIDEAVDLVIEETKKIKYSYIKVKVLSRFIITLCMIGEKKAAKRIEDLVNDSMIENLPRRIVAGYILAKAMCKDDAYGLLKSAIDFAKQDNEKDILIKAHMILCRIYFAKWKKFDAMNHCLEACSLIRDLMGGVSEKNRDAFLKVNFYDEPFKLIISKERPELYEKTTSLNDLIEQYKVEEYLYTNEFRNYMLIREMEVVFGYEITDRDFIEAAYGAGNEKTDFIMKYLKTILLADRGIVVTLSESGILDVRYSTTSRDQSLPDNRKIFRAVQKSGKSMIARKEKDCFYQMVPSGNIKEILCIPLSREKAKGRSEIFGFVYFETGRVVNNFTRNIIERAIQYSDLIALLAEANLLREEAYIDRLTGFYVRKQFDTEINYIFREAEDNSRTFSIIMYDLDKFKRVNDTYGHRKGDLVLREVSNVVRQNIDSDDIAARYGGEEFMIICPGQSSKQAYEKAEKIRAAVEAENILGHAMPVTISLGIANYPEHTRSFEELLNFVDMATYASKEDGRNKATVWSEKFSGITSSNRDAGVLTGDEETDRRNLRVIRELLEMMKENLPKEEKIKKFMVSMCELSGAEVGMYIKTDNEGRIAESKKMVVGENLDKGKIEINQKIIKKVIKGNKGTYTIDWEGAKKSAGSNGMIVYRSIIAIPLIKEGHAPIVLYFSVSGREKEFGEREYSLIGFMADIMINII